MAYVIVVTTLVVCLRKTTEVCLWLNHRLQTGSREFEVWHWQLAASGTVVRMLTATSSFQK